MALLNAAGYDVIVITNQSCVGRGEVSPDMLHRINKRLSSVISDGGGRLERIYVCPHRPEDRCPCRKPLPGLLLLAGRDYNMDLSQTWFVGDSLTDMQAASAAGCRPALVLTGKVTSKSAPLEVPVFDNLLAFARHLMPPNIPTVNEPQAQRG